MMALTVGSQPAAPQRCAGGNPTRDQLHRGDCSFVQRRLTDGDDPAVAAWWRAGNPNVPADIDHHTSNPGREAGGGHHVGG